MSDAAEVSRRNVLITGGVAAPPPHHCSGATEPGQR